MLAALPPERATSVGGAECTDVVVGCANAGRDGERLAMNVPLCFLFEYSRAFLGDHGLLCRKFTTAALASSRQDYTAASAVQVVVYFLDNKFKTSSTSRAMDVGTLLSFSLSIAIPHCFVWCPPYPPTINSIWHDFTREALREAGTQSTPPPPLPSAINTYFSRRPMHYYYTSTYNM